MDLKKEKATATVSFPILSGSGSPARVSVLRRAASCLKIAGSVRWANDSGDMEMKNVRVVARDVQKKKCSRRRRRPILCLQPDARAYSGLGRQ